MSIADTKVRRLRLGPLSAGMLLTPAEFDRARFSDGWRFELINGVLVVSPYAARSEQHRNELLGNLLWFYQENHPEGSALDLTLPEETLECGESRRRVDRVIWAGLGRLPEPGDPPAVVAELVSAGKVDQERDYVAKRAEYRAIRVREYWVIDRFRRRLTVFLFGRQKDEERLVPEGKSYMTPLLPGFELPVARLLKLTDRSAKKRRRSPDGQRTRG
jgi:Uma2 family endonuclease